MTDRQVEDRDRSDVKSHSFTTVDCSCHTRMSNREFSFADHASALLSEWVVAISE